MSCHQNSNLVISYLGSDKFYLQRCCLLKGITISCEEFFSMSLSELNKKVLENLNTKDSIGPCSNNCSLKEIDKISLNMLRRCNLKCFNCCSLNDKELLSREDYLKRKEMFFKIIDFFKHSNIHFLCVDGCGETFIYYNELIPFLYSLKDTSYKQLSFITNGTLLSREKILNLKSISEQTNITYDFLISVDAIDEKTYNEVRLGGNFKKVIENLYILKENFYTQVAFTVKKLNIENVPLVEEFFKDKCERVLWSFDMFDHSLSKYIPKDKYWDYLPTP